MIACVALGAIAAWAEGLAGKWNATVQTPDGPMNAVYEFAVTDGKISGTVQAQDTKGAITGGSIQGDEVTFVVAAEMDGAMRKFTHKGKLSGDTLDLQIDMGDEQIPVKAKRAQ